MMTILIVVWLIYLHVAGAFLFIKFASNLRPDTLKNTQKLPRFIQLLFWSLWPYFLFWWFLNLRKVQP